MRIINKSACWPKGKTRTKGEKERGTKTQVSTKHEWEVTKSQRQNAMPWEIKNSQTLGWWPTGRDITEAIKHWVYGWLKGFFKKEFSSFDSQLHQST